MALSMRATALFARSASVEQSFRLPSIGESLIVERTSLRMPSESSRNFGFVSSCRLSSPMKRLHLTVSSFESVAVTSDALNDLCICAREPSTVSNAWVPNTPYSFSSAALNAAIVASFIFALCENTKFPSRAVAVSPWPCTAMSREPNMVWLAMVLKESMFSGIKLLLRLVYTARGGMVTG